MNQQIPSDSVFHLLLRAHEVPMAQQGSSIRYASIINQLIHISGNCWYNLAL